MTVETGTSIADLDPNAPVNEQFAGEGNEHIQRTKVSLTYTFEGSAGDRYDETSGPVLVGPVALNRVPTDITNIAAEIGLDLDNITDPSTIDDILGNSVRRDVPEAITETWQFSGDVDFNTGNFTFTGVVPTIDTVDVATVNDIPTYLERSRLVSKIISTTPYAVLPEDIGTKLSYVGSANGTVDIGSEGVDSDLLFVTNNNSSGSPLSHVLTLTTASGTFLLPDGTSGTTITITGRTRTVGLHRVGSAWQVTGDVD